MALDLVWNFGSGDANREPGKLITGHGLIQALTYMAKASGVQAISHSGQQHTHAYMQRRGKKSRWDVKAEVDLEVTWGQMVCPGPGLLPSADSLIGCEHNLTRLWLSTTL